MKAGPGEGWSDMTDPATAERLRPGDHVCWTFDDDQRWLASAAILVRDGLTSGQKVLFFTDVLSTGGLTAALAEHRVPASAAAVTGQLRVKHATESYRTGKRPWAASMAEVWTHEVDLARREGWPGVRMIGDMTWAARRAVGADRIAWYEARINRIFADGYATAVCFYDRRLFTNRELNRITAAHPATMGGGVARDAPWRPLLRFRRTTDPDGLRLSGQADASNRGALSAMLTGLVEDGADHPPVIVDVSELTFADGAAAHLLVRTAHVAPSGLRLAGCSPGLARLLDLVADHVLPTGLVVEPV